MSLRTSMLKIYSYHIVYEKIKVLKTSSEKFDITNFEVKVMA